MNLPNKLTTIRILLIPFLVFFIISETIKYNYLYALIIFIVASVTDQLDGLIARKYNLVTNFGKFADPLADKILVISAYLCFIQMNIIDVIPIIIIIAREFIVTSVRLIASNEGKVIAANFWGKAKTVSQIICIIAILLIGFINQYSINILNNDSYQLIFYLVTQSLLWLSVIFTVISGFIYVFENKEFIKQLK